MKKIKNTLFIIVALFISVVCIHTIYNDDFKLRDYVINDLNEKIIKVGDYARNINISFNKTGKIKLNALYKGAHGESNPSEFNYNFSLDNGIYIVENEDGFLEFDMSILTKIIDTFASLKTLEPELIVNKTTKNNIIVYELDKDIINQIYSTDFKTITIDVKTNGFIKQVSSYSLRLDDYVININDKKIEVNGKNNITLTFGNKGYSLNINDKLKMNVINYYQYNILINDTSLFLELTDEGFYLSALTTHAIYNSLEITGVYENADIEKNKEVDPILNPLYRYFNEVSFDIWR
ncbi:unknown [Firmicutes bacterium CAG:582]|nr:unknown [Firmicutes bacterium CAG:582]